MYKRFERGFYMFTYILRTGKTTICRNGTGRCLRERDRKMNAHRLCQRAIVMMTTMMMIMMATMTATYSEDVRRHRWFSLFFFRQISINSCVCACNFITKRTSLFFLLVLFVSVYLLHLRRWTRKSAMFIFVWFSLCLTQEYRAARRSTVHLHCGWKWRREKKKQKKSCLR